MLPVIPAHARVPAPISLARHADAEQPAENMDIDGPSVAGQSLDSLLAAGAGVAARVGAAADARAEGEEEEEPTTPRAAVMVGANSADPSSSRLRSSIDLDHTGSQISSPIPGVLFWTPPAKLFRSRATAPPHSEGRLERVQRELRLPGLIRTPSEILRESTNSHGTPRGEGTHYLTLKPMFELLVDGQYQAPTVYQPTPEGLRTLVAHHTQRNTVDFRVHEKSDQTPDRVAARVTEFLRDADLSSLSENHPIGVILSHEQMHAIPLFLAMRDGQKYLLVLDSTSGPVQQQYWSVAQAFPDFQVRLNAGTRQADNQSCINDAFEILKQCFTVGNLIDRVDSRRVASEPSNPAPTAHTTHSRLRLKRPEQPGNFSTFRLPEELAFVAQRAAHLEEAGVNMDKPVTVESRTCPLGMHTMIATDFGRKTRVDEQGATTTDRLKANVYLYEASRRHRDIIEAMLARVQP